MSADERIVIDWLTDPAAFQRAGVSGKHVPAAVPVSVIEAAERIKAAESVAPPWAEVLLDSLFTGSRLDFKDIEIPGWLQARLEAEYGMPVPTGQPVPSAPVDLDDERPNRGSVFVDPPDIPRGWPESSDVP